MGRSREEMAADRERMYDDRIREALAAGDTQQALQAAVDYLQSEATKRRDRKAAEGALIDADLAGLIRYFASAIPGLRAARPERCPLVPRPQDLLAVYEETLRRSATGAAP